MFDITPTKTFMDSVHGYINIPKCFVDNIINTELFQRLRNIDQTGMRILYPDAKHDRFGHSLGVFYLGSKAVDALLFNFSNDMYWEISSDNKKALFWAKNKMLFLLACLLHDIGHAPFSHSLEGIIFSNSITGKKRFGDLFCEKINAKETMDEMIVEVGNVAPHEIIGGMLIMDRFQEYIEKVYDELIAMRYPEENDEHILYAEHYQRGGHLDKNELDNDICFIVRMITGLKYQGYEPEKQIRNCFIELLNGGNFDVDKLDYIVRDTKMSGISNINIDIERLLKSVCIVLKTKCVNKKFEKWDSSNCTIHSLNNFNNNENMFQIVGNFNGKFVFGEGTQVVLKKESTFVSLMGYSENAKIRYINNPAKFTKETKIYRDGTYLHNVRNGMIDLPDKVNNEAFEVNIQNAKVASENGFEFKVDEENGKMIMNVNGFCDISVKGSWKSESAISFFENTVISGEVRELEFMGDVIKESLPTNEEYTTFSVGFKKQALNIIANVLEARDYLYLWVYAHHKVIYYANFLLPVLATVLLPTNTSSDYKNFPAWNLNYDDLEYLDDAYLWTVIKYARNNSTDLIKDLCAELLSRNYKISMYKSLAEFELLFEEFSDEQRMLIRRHLLDQIDINKPCVMNGGDITAGYLNEELVEQIRGYGKLENITNIVYVDANYKPKNINTHETYITIQGDPISVSKIPLLANRNILANRVSTKYFYLYYNSSTINEEEKNMENRNIKNSIKSYFKNIFDF